MGSTPSTRTSGLSGVIINKAGSDRHAREIVESIQAIGLECSVYCRAMPASRFPRDILVWSRQRNVRRRLRRWLSSAERISDHVVTQLDHLRRTVGAGAETEPWSPPTKYGRRRMRVPWWRLRPVGPLRSAMPKPTSCYALPDVNRWFSIPLSDEQLPAGTAGLYLGGGFPEVHAAELAANDSLRSDIRAAIEAGTPTVAECAGLLYLCQSVDGLPYGGRDRG